MGFYNFVSESSLNISFLLKRPYFCIVWLPIRKVLWIYPMWVRSHVLDMNFTQGHIFHKWTKWKLWFLFAICLDRIYPPVKFNESESQFLFKKYLHCKVLTKYYQDWQSSQEQNSFFQRVLVRKQKSQKLSPL